MLTFKMGWLTRLVSLDIAWLVLLRVSAIAGKEDALRAPTSSIMLCNDLEESSAFRMMLMPCIFASSR
jgi:hypothetical protein